MSSSLGEIHTKNASKLSFEELYRNAYKIVLKKKGEVLYERVKSFEQEWLTQQVLTRITSLVIQSLLPGADNGSSGIFASERRAAGERFLRGLKQAWEDHQVCMNMTTDVLMYMVRHSLFQKPHLHFLTTLVGSRLLCRSAQALHLRRRHGFVPRLHPEVDVTGYRPAGNHHISA